MIKKLYILLGIASMCLGIFWLTRYYYTWDATTVEEQSVVLKNRIETVAKLVNVEGYFSEVYDYKDYWGYDFSPFRKKALVRVKAKVLVGYDLEQMKVETRPAEKKILLSNLPDPQILSIDHDLDYYDLSQGTFNSFSAEDYNKINSTAKELIESKAKESDLFITAEEQSNHMLEMIEYLVESAGWTLEYQPRTVPLEVPSIE